MTTTFNQRSQTFTIKGITTEQLSIIAYLVNSAQEYTTGQQEEKTLAEDGFIDITTIGCITFDTEDVDTLHTIII